jgi:hypothetical protein
MAYNIIHYDSSNLKILNNIETINGEFISKGQNVINNVSNYVLSTSNILFANIKNLDNKLFDTSNLIKIENLPISSYDANGSKLGIIKVDGITITVDESGIIRGNSNIDLSTYATKNELSSVASGLTVLESADLASTTNYTINQPITTTVDGVFPSTGSSILLKNQTNKYENGVYIFTSSSTLLTRRSDFNTVNNIKKGSYIFIKNGIDNKNSGFININNITTLNTDPIEFNLFTKTEITAGNGISLSGSSVSLKTVSEGGIVFNSGSAEINLSGTSIKGVLPIVRGGTGANNLDNLINLSTHTNGILPVVKGGTGASSFANLINLSTDTNDILPIAKGGSGASSFANLINLSTDTNGILSVNKGGTGLSTLVPNLLVVGNGTNSPLQTANLSWNNDTNTLSATNITGVGTNITSINAANISSGILPIARGGTGSSTLTADLIEQGVNKRFIINNKISLTNQQDLRVATNIVPDLNDTYSLGSSNYRWKDIFVSANTITIGEAKLSSSPTGALEMSSVSFTEKINLITSNELHSLVGINKNVQQQINELNLDNIANGNNNKYIANDQYNGSITISSNLNVGTYYSSENPNGNLHVFGDLILEGSNITTFSPFITQIHRHLSNYNTGFIDIHNIDNTSNKPSIKIKHNTDYSNILECYSKDDMELNNPIFIISSNGFIGINNSKPVEKLDVIGNIKYTGKINNITSNELNHLTGIDYNIKQRIYDNNINQSNYVLNISNILNTDYNRLDKNVSNYILNISNILQSNSKDNNLSNYIINISNILNTDYNRLDKNVSNYILNESNILNTDYNRLDKNVSNYVLVSNNNTSKYASNLNVNISNYLENHVLNTSNVISSRISSLTTDKITQGTQNKYITNDIYNGHLNINYVNQDQSVLNITASPNNNNGSDIVNIKKGTDTVFKMISNGNIAINKGTNVPLVALDINGDINFTGMINNITSNEISNLKNINYNIKQRIDSNDSNQSNYVSTTNNTLSTRISSLTADDIAQGTQKKFIVNNIYDGSLTINNNLNIHSNLIVYSNLTVLGSTTTLNTDVYTTERLDISNENPASTALTVRQVGNTKKILSAFTTDTNTEVFTINTNGRVGINKTIPEYNLDITGDIRITGDLYKGTEKFKASNWTSNINGILTYSNVAIGKELVSNSIHKLDVGGNINFTGDLYKSGTVFKASNWTSNINGLFYNSTSVGIGTTTILANVLFQVGNGGALRITNNPLSYSLIGTDSAESDSNTRIVLSGNTRTGNLGHIEYAATSTGNHMFFTTNSKTERMRITTGGNIGFGTNNPNANLHLHGNAASQNVRISFTDNTSGVATTDGFCIGKDATQKGYIYNTENADIEIGTNNTARITISGSGAISTNNNNINAGSGTITATTFSGALSGNATSAGGLTGTPNITVGTISTSGAITTNNNNINAGSGTITATTFSGALSGNATSAGGLTGTPNITVGTISTSGAITTNNNNINAGSGTITAATFSGALSGNATSATNASGLTGTPNITVGTISCSTITGSGQLNQLTNNTDGAVGLNIKNNSSGSSAYSYLGVQNSAGTACSIFLNSSTRTTDGGINTATLRNDAGDLVLATAGNAAYIYLKNSNGNVGINIINPKEKLDVDGNIIASGSITSFGDYSDERLKDREGNIENPLDIVDKLQGFYYRPNKTANDLGIKGNKRDLGISAQDVEKILPDLVNIAPVDVGYDEEKNIISKTGSNYLTVNYEKMIPLLIESIKELNKNINALKKENIELRDLIKSQ